MSEAPNSCVATMVLHDVFDGDVYDSTRRIGGINEPVRSFVWEVRTDGTVEMTDFYGSTGKPRRYVVGIEEIRTKYPLLEKNPAMRRRYAHRIKWGTVH